MVGDLDTPAVFAMGGRRDCEQVWLDHGVTRPTEFMVRHLLALVQAGRVTSRDVRVLIALLEHRFLTTAMIQALFFQGASRNVARDRMRALLRLGVVSVFTWTDADRGQAKTHVWCLSTAGALLIKHYREGVRLGAWDHTRNVRPMEVVFRILQTNQIYVLLRAAEAPGIGLAVFRVDPRVELYRDESGRMWVVHPSAAFTWRRGPRLRRFLVEVLRMPSGIDSFRRVVRMYTRYHDESAPVDVMGEDRAGILVVTEDESMAEEAARMVWDAAGTDLPALFTTDAKLAEQGIVGSDAWMILGDGGRLEHFSASIFSPPASVRMAAAGR